MQTTLRILKNNKQELSKYGKLLGLNTESWPTLFSNLIISDLGRLNAVDGTTISVIPTKILQTTQDANKVALIFAGILQPNTSLVSNRVMFADSFNKVVDRYGKAGLFPTLSKGVSYPSSLQRNKSDGIMESENVWLVDLFSGGIAYQRTISSQNKYYVVDTTIYEGWNRFSGDEINSIFQNLPADTGKAVVERFISLLDQPKFGFVKQNCNIRSTYLAAICQVVGLPPLIRMEEKIKDPVYQKYLTEILSTTDPLKAFCYEGDTNARDFAPFIYAEEMYLRKMYGIDICTGPIREDLPLNLTVLELCRRVNKRPTEIVWYTRPNKYPELFFSSSLKDVVNEIETSQTMRQFIAENLAKLGLITESEMINGDAVILAKTFFSFMQQVEKRAQQKLRGSKSV